jgi:uncharacterized protein (UPF0261 family)
MSGKNVVIIGTLDTKGPETAYLRDQMEELGLDTTVVDSGILEEPKDITPDIDHGEVATYADTTIEALRNVGDRGPAIEQMREALKNLTRELYAEGELDALVSLGGAEGAVMGAAAAMQLPVGVPKIIISPIASGKHYFDPLVGTKDMMVVHSIVDILGLNPIACTVFDNVAAAISGLVEDGHALSDPDPDKTYIATTMLGNTTTAVMAMKERLEEENIETVVFHSNGVGGHAMEELAREGQFDGVIDFTTNETYDPMVGGMHDGGEDRLNTVGELGLPQVVVPGCIDFAAFHSDSVPEELQDRPFYDHNPEYTLVRTSHDEMIKLGELFGERLSKAKGPVKVAIPTLGLSIPNHSDGGNFWNPEADEAFRDTLRKHLDERIPIKLYERHVNDEEFGREVAELFLDTYSEEE